VDKFIYIIICRSIYSRLLRKKRKRF